MPEAVANRPIKLTDRTITMFGKPYRWQQYDGGKRVRVAGRWRLERLPGTVADNGPYDPHGPMTPSPCAAWEQAHRPSGPAAGMTEEEPCPPTTPPTPASGSSA